MLHYLKGDALTADIPNHALVHQVNTLGVFGAGIAKQIKNIYPHVYNVYKSKHDDDGWLLGDVQIVPTPQNPHNISCSCVVNLAAQDTVGRSLNTSYEALETGVRELLNWCSEQGVFNISSPKIGSGLGGGDWNRIESILKKYLKDHPNINWYVYTFE